MADNAADFPGADQREVLPPRPPSIWYWVALCILGAALLYLVASVFRTYEFNSIPARERLREIANNGLGLLTAIFVLAAAVAGLQIERARRKTVNLFILGGAILVAAGALFSIIDMFTIHVPGPNDQESVSFGLNGINWNQRLAIITPAIAALLLAAAAIVVARAPSAAPDEV